MNETEHETSIYLDAIARLIDLCEGYGAEPSTIVDELLGAGVDRNLLLSDFNFDSCYVPDEDDKSSQN